MKVISVFLFWGILHSAFGQPIPGVPEVSQNGGTITGIPAPNHQASGAEITIIESKECSAKKAGNQSLQVGNTCGYLRGRFSYRFRDASSERMKRVFVGFAITRKGKQQVSFLENSPVYFDESL